MNRRDEVSLKADRRTTAQSGTVWTVIIATAERIIKTAQANRTDGAIISSVGAGGGSEGDRAQVLNPGGLSSPLFGQNCM